MHLRSRNLPRPSASSPLDNRAPPMANASPVPDLEGLHHEIHGMAEQMRVMNENNARLIQLLAAANPQLHRPFPISSDLAILIDRGIVLITSVPNERGIGHEHQVRPYVNGVPLRNLVKRDPEREGGEALTEGATPGHEISPPHRRFEIWMPGLMPLTLELMLQ
ncbi:hypothetical protein Acr_11g0015400 [Actinidia rufa]|uniref:Uncharacterized protein n=1 Tax=Actinidia rufa TaxID=165716 RepID=A0A7J0FEV5_9ERIC|nr:hypothetical protein Acr_11g0015400 [Actinidia rufa]